MSPGAPTGRAANLPRHALALAGSALGTAGMFTLVLSLNTDVPARPHTRGGEPVAMAVVRKPPAERRAPERRPEPTRERTARPTAPPPRVAASAMADVDLGLGGLDLGLGKTQVGDLAGKTDVSRLVMSEGAVDSPPRATTRIAPRYPARARADNIEGHVVLSLLIDAAGRVERAQVVESQPPGIFDDAALEAVRQWRFEPANYQGNAVKAWARQRMPFVLL